MKTKHLIIKTILLYIIISGNSCKKFLDIGGPTTSTNAENVYKSDFTAAAVLTGLYAQMMSIEFSTGGVTSLSLIPELSADNLVVYNQGAVGYINYWQNALNPYYESTDNYFTSIYPKIYTVNAVIEGLSNNQLVTQSVQKRLLGESYFLRAFFYYYLVNLYGDVPLALSTDYAINARQERTSKNTIYHQILGDLQKAKSFLSDDYVNGTITQNTMERIRPNLSTALALEARVNLFTKDFYSAEKAATEVIQKNGLYDLTTLDSVFLKNSKETIWALKPVKSNFNTDEASIFILTSPPGPTAKSFALSSSLISSFEDNDKRLEKWTGTYISGSDVYPFAYKYKIDANTSSVTEYCVVFRLAEQYLIRAEARLEQNNISGAKEDINTIRSRAGLASTNASTAEALRKVILHERRAELFTEWGHRWFDIKRSNLFNAIMQEAEITKGGVWASYKSLYPIPNSEIIRNTKLTQNPGY